MGHVACGAPNEGGHKLGVQRNAHAYYCSFAACNRQILGACCDWCADMCLRGGHFGQLGDPLHLCGRR